MELHRGFIPELEPGSLFGERYRIAAPIGRGGMGSVYLVEDMRLNGKKRALKLTPASPGDRESFIREARLLSELQHPHLPDIVDYFAPENGGWAAIVMSYVDGESLHERFVRCGCRLPFKQALPYLEQLCGLLSYLHGRTPMIVFRDLKPANVLIDRHDRAVLVDFGIARAFRPEAASDTERLGTPAFAAPEQIMGQQTDARSDVYSWGALAYYLLSGGQYAIRQRGPIRGQLQDDVPADWIDLLELTLSHNPAGRPQSASELQRLLSGRSAARMRESVHQPAITNPMPKDRRDVTGAVAIAAVMSAYPGAGATLSALGLSRHLSEAGVHHALVELPGGEPELYGWLDGARNMPKHAVYADPAGIGPAVPAWRNGPCACRYPLAPDEVPRPPESGFEGWLNRLGVPIVLLDVSSKWELPAIASWLSESRLHSLWWVADNMPVKWTPRRLAAAAELQAKSAENGAVSGWIANRDCAFDHRKEWLRCFPEPPVATLPLLPYHMAIRSIWRGEGYPSSDIPAANGSNPYRNWAKAIMESRNKRA